MKRTPLILIVFVLISAMIYVGWPRASLPFPEAITSMTLYSIDGRGIEEPKPGQPTFHHYPVLGKTALDVHQRDLVLHALNRGVARHGGGAMACHWPRHGLRIAGGNKTVDYAICFECENIEIFDGDSRTWAYTTPDPQTALNDVLTRAGVELAPGMIEVR